MKKLLIGIIFSISAIMSADAAVPDVTAATWTGTLIVGTTLTLTGINLPTTMPTVVIMDNFENGMLGAGMSNLTAASYVGNWSTPTATGNGPVYSNTQAASGSKSMVVDMTLGANGGEFYNQIFLSSATQYMICYDWGLTGDWPGYGGTGANMKFDWTMFGNSTTNSDFYHGFGISGSNIPTTVSLLSNDSTTNWSTSVRNFTINLATSTSPEAFKWKEICKGINGVGTGDMFFVDRSSTGTFRVSYSTAVGIPFLTDPETQNGYWDRIHIPGFGRVTTTPTFWYFDNIYVATGTASFARIILHNQPRFYDSTERTVLKPVSFTGGTQVQAMLTTTAVTGTGYLTICDANNVCDDTGFAVVLGASYSGGTNTFGGAAPRNTFPMGSGMSVGEDN